MIKTFSNLGIEGEIFQLDKNTHTHTHTKPIVKIIANSEKHKALLPSDEVQDKDITTNHSLSVLYRKFQVIQQARK